MRVGQGRRKAIQASTLPRSPEFLARRERSTPLTDRLEGRGHVRTMTLQDVADGEVTLEKVAASVVHTDHEPLTVRMTCPDHGQLVARPVACRHELDALVEEVRNAHFSGYGADCDQPLTIRHGGQGAAGE